MVSARLRVGSSLAIQNEKPPLRVQRCGDGGTDGQIGDPAKAAAAIAAAPETAAGFILLGRRNDDLDKGQA